MARGVFMSCQGKQRFPSWRLAHEVAERMTARHEEPFTPYRCQSRDCKGWHVGYAATEGLARHDGRPRKPEQEEETP